jgi:hypothetical protein
MPNWVTTRIFITGPEDKIKEFEDKVIDMSEEADKAFSFQRILPIPADLVNTTAPNPRPEIKKVINSKGEEETVEVYPMFTNQWEINSAVQRGETPPEPIPCNNATPQMCEELILKYGRANWYDWQCFNWGTKWDASESIYNQEDKMIEFQTAWSCPSEVIQKMADMFPDLKFNGTYADEDFGSNVGYIENGFPYSFENGTEEAYETAATLWGYEGYYDDDKGKWIFEGDCVDLNEDEDE